MQHLSLRFVTSQMLGVVEPARPYSVPTAPPAGTRGAANSPKMLLQTACMNAAVCMNDVKEVHGECTGSDGSENPLWQ